DRRNAVAWPTSSGWLEAHDATERCWHSDRPNGVTAQGRGNEAGGHGCGRAARGAARDAIWCVRILHLAVTCVVTGQAVRHLDEVVLPKDQGTRTLDGAHSVRLF